DEFAQLFRRNPTADIGIKDLQEIAEFLSFGLFTECFKREQSLAILLQVVNESHRIEPQVSAGKILRGAIALNAAALNLIDGRSPKRLRRLARVASMAHCPNVGGVIGSRRWGHVRFLE